VTIEALRAAAFETNGGLAVPEPAVKAWLRGRLGGRIVTPASVTLPSDTSTWAPDACAGLREPVVLKAFGPGLVHKSEAGAVRLGLPLAGVAAAADAMRASLTDQGLEPGGFLVEEQLAGGVELIVGVVRHPAAGPVVMLGAGGTLAEVLDRSVVRLCPLTSKAAAEMVDELPAALLDGARGRQPVDRRAVVDLLLAVAGAERSVTAELGDELLEFECNPVLATAAGAYALDARLILARGETLTSALPAAPATDFRRLFAPRRVAVAGASSGKTTFGNRFLAAYRAAGWTDNLYAIHPTAEQIDGVPAVASIAQVPGGADYALVAVPASRCADVVREAAASPGERPFVHIVSGGFGETGSDGVRLQDQLCATAREVGVRVLGPNCMGIYSPRGRQTFQLGAGGEPGAVSVLSQSGGLTGDILQAGRRAGLRFAHLASIGNAIDVTAGELLDWLVDDPDTSIIGLYLEGLADGRRLADALCRADGGKPVVLLTGGISAQGARAVASHTGSMTTDARIWEAIVRSTGAVHVATLEDLVGTLAHLQRWAQLPQLTGEQQVLIVGPGGGASVLSADACDRAGLELARVTESTQKELRGLGYGAGTSVANPLEIPLGPATGPDTFARILEPLLAREQFSDLLLHVNVAAYYGYGPPDLTPLVELIHATGQIDTAGGRVALVLRNADVARGEDADRVAEAARTAGLPLFSTLDGAARAIAAVQHFSSRRPG
jgi:acyl-CoA synthetase (NDP forming)